jgi:hypothetical protein
MPLLPFSEPTERIVQLLQERQPFSSPGDDRSAAPKLNTLAHGNESLSRERLHEIVNGALNDYRRSLPEWGSAGVSLSILFAAISVPGVECGLYAEDVLKGGERTWQLVGTGSGITDDEGGDKRPAAAMLICEDLRHPGACAPGMRYGAILVLAGALAEAIYQRAMRHGLAATVNMAPDLWAVGTARRVRRSLRHIVTVEIDEIESSK